MEETLLTSDASEFGCFPKIGLQLVPLRLNFSGLVWPTVITSLKKTKVCSLLFNTKLNL